MQSYDYREGIMTSRERVFEVAASGAAKYWSEQAIPYSQRIIPGDGSLSAYVADAMMWSLCIKTEHNHDKNSRNVNGIYCNNCGAEKEAE